MCKQKLSTEHARACDDDIMREKTFCDWAFLIAVPQMILDSVPLKFMIYSKYLF